jgi:hypothetical protein
MSKTERDFWKYHRDFIDEGLTYQQIASKHGAKHAAVKTTLERGRKLFNLPAGARHEIWLIMGCVHVPFENKILFDKILNLIKDLDTSLYGIVLNGDFLDLASLSSHDVGNKPIVEGLDISHEYEAGRARIAQLVDAAAKGTKFHYTWGNHEDRYKRWRKAMANSKFSGAVNSPTEALYLDEYGFEVMENWKHDYKLLGDDLQVMHGDFCNVHTAKKHTDKFEASVIFNHTHRVQSWTNAKRGGYNIGWLGDLGHPAFGYMGRGPKLDWQNAFAIATITDDGRHHVNTIECYNNQFVYGNKLY